MTRPLLAAMMGLCIFAATTAQAQTEDHGFRHPDDPSRRARECFNEGNYECARVELERLFQLTPHYKLLYVLAACYEALGDDVQAVVSLQRYLAMGGGEIPAPRRDEVDAKLAALRPRIARLTVRINVAGAVLSVDDQCSIEASTGKVNCGALDGDSVTILVNPGRRRIALRKDNFLPETQVVTLAGSDDMTLTMSLKPQKPHCAECFHENPFRLPATVSWGVAIGAAIGASATAVATTTVPHEDVGGLRTAAYAFLVGTGVAAATATYFTVRAGNWTGSIRCCARGLTLQGSF
jgi:hypothetical protein